jgi:hypothetical protein
MKSALKDVRRSAFGSNSAPDAKAKDSDILSPNVASRRRRTATGSSNSRKSAVTITTKSDHRVPPISQKSSPEDKENGEHEPDFDLTTIYADSSSSYFSETTTRMSSERLTFTPSASPSRLTTIAAEALSISCRSQCAVNVKCFKQLQDPVMFLPLAPSVRRCPMNLSAGRRRRSRVWRCGWATRWRLVLTRFD